MQAINIYCKLSLEVICKLVFIKKLAIIFKYFCCVFRFSSKEFKISSLVLRIFSSFTFGFLALKS
ncbi:hypothetical protein CW576_05925 [Campylobacter jejuni]|uniref:Uncharacterized protein n=1 Tax=Campylobacter jejuni TaxID=197 RepID=A0A5C4YE83_CAMJU|nr:hypothetical protein [Campylobacter jejuni]EAI4846140.1 hypothetical protein [Campylobacter jejuni]EAI6346194.1 hypothetical protein [Campylobacter jejuni]EAI8595763.1 hypothetical protein [Campylobacter jejuni]EAI8631636.1 hypothetical protein [Campylobacter jejuni]